MGALLLDTTAVTELYPDNRLYADYVEGRADAFFTHPVGQLDAALAARRVWPTPRSAVVEVLREYHRSLAAPPAVVDNLDRLGSADCLCVTTGQQVGLLGGPGYTLYKALTAIRLAKQVEQELGVACVPVFWLASEDHDLAEVNHAHVQLDDGQTRRVHFSWEGEGRSISDLPWTAAVAESVAAFWSLMGHATCRAQAQAIYAPDADASSPDSPGGFVRVAARALLRLAGEYGLILIEPRLLRPLAGPFQRHALARAVQIRGAIEAASRQIAAAGHRAALDSERAGTLFQYVAGARSRLTLSECRQLAASPPPPERLSTDAALRPVFADTLLPTVATVLGPGEIAYHAMLRQVYEVFGVPQPLVAARQGCTVLPPAAPQVLRRYGVAGGELLSPRFRAKRAVADSAPAAEREPFAKARRGAAAALDPLRETVAATDPNLLQTWERTRGAVELALSRLEERTLRALMGGGNADGRRLRQLANLARPRGGLQERILPIAHFIATYGVRFVRLVAHAFDHTDERTHAVIAIPEEREEA